MSLVCDVSFLPCVCVYIPVSPSHAYICVHVYTCVSLPRSTQSSRSRYMTRLTPTRPGLRTGHLSPGPITTLSGMTYRNLSSRAARISARERRCAYVSVCVLYLCSCSIFICYISVPDSDTICISVRVLLHESDLTFLYRQMTLQVLMVTLCDYDMPTGRDSTGQNSVSVSLCLFLCAFTCVCECVCVFVCVCVYVCLSRCVYLSARTRVCAHQQTETTHPHAPTHPRTHAPTLSHTPTHPRTHAPTHVHAHRANGVCRTGSYPAGFVCHPETNRRCRGRQGRGPSPRRRYGGC